MFMLVCSLCLAAISLPAYATSNQTNNTSSATDNAIPSRDALAAALNRVEHFAEYQTYAARGTTGQEPFYKEYAHLRSLAAEMRQVHANYSTIATSADSWKIAYLIDYSAGALRGCEYLFGLKKQAAQTSQSVQSTHSSPAVQTSQAVQSAQTASASTPTVTPAATSNTASIAQSDQNSANPQTTQAQATSAAQAAQNSTSVPATNAQTSPSNQAIASPQTTQTTPAVQTKSTTSTNSAQPFTRSRTVRPFVRQLVQLCANVPAHPDQLDLPRRRALLVESV